MWREDIVTPEEKKFPPKLMNGMKTFNGNEDI